MDFALQGSVAVVTGGTRGIGRVIAMQLAEQGCTVVTCGRTVPELLPERESLLQTQTVGFTALDVRDAAAVEKFIDGVVETHGALDIIVNNAGGSPQSEAATASPRFADAITALNLLAPYYVARAAHRHMKAAGGGAIVNIASVAGIRPSPGTALYGAAKAGLLSLTKSLAQEWGADAIRVNAIIVGLAETENAAATYGDTAARARIAASLPLGRMAQGEDVARAVLYLVSDASSYISGAQVNVDGGGERPLFLELLGE